MTHLKKKFGKIITMITAMAMAVSLLSSAAFAADGTEGTLAAGTYTVPVSLSAYINAMGGIEFGDGLVEDTADLTVDSDGNYTVTIYLGTNTGVIYTVEYTAFVDATDSTPGYYSDGTIVDAQYTLSDDTAQDSSGNEINYVDSMTFTLPDLSGSYYLWIYVNSSVMGVQFCDGTGSGASNTPGVSTPYTATLTVDLSNCTLVELAQSEDSDDSSDDDGSSDDSSSDTDDGLTNDDSTDDGSSDGDSSDDGSSDGDSSDDSSTDNDSSDDSTAPPDKPEDDNSSDNGSADDDSSDNGSSDDDSSDDSTTTPDEPEDDNTSADGSVGESSPNDNSTDDGSSDDDSTDDGTTDDSSSDNGSADDDSADNGSSDNGSTDNGSSGNGSSDNDSSDNGSSDDNSSDNGSSDDGSSNDDSSGNGSSDGDSSDNSSSGNGSTDNGSSDNGSSDDDSSDSDSTDNDSADNDSTDNDSSDNGSSDTDDSSSGTGSQTLDVSSLSAGTYSVEVNLSAYINAMGGIEFGDGLVAETSAILTVSEDGTYALTVSTTKSSVTIYTVTCYTFIDASVSAPGYYDADGNLVYIGYTLSSDTAANPDGDEVNYVDSLSFELDTISDTYDLYIYVNSSVMGQQFGNDTSYSATLTVDWSTLTLVSSAVEDVDTTGTGSASSSSSSSSSTDTEETTTAAEEEELAYGLDVGTYYPDASLSAYISAMGGVEFGSGLLKSVKVVVNEDGTYTITIYFTTSSVSIYTVTCDTFVDASDSTPGYYTSSGKLVYASYTLSSNTATDADGNAVHYVDSMTFTVDELQSAYYLYIYVNSSVMGVQFCNGSGSGSSNQPGVTTPYAAVLTIDWSSIGATVESSPITGQEENMTAWALILAAAALCAVLLTVYRKRNFE